ncbi:39S ribosomal protein L18, mitochondrial [Halotydeus destructor]|nr:39S ribosomal protein L18, mitochondrial [Halotydeus destructor]
MSRIIKKRITRLPAGYEVYKEEIEDGQKGPNDAVPLKLVNRNPRNLEMLSRQAKPLGWELETPSNAFWNKVVFERNGRYLTAKVIHNSGRTLVSACTSEESYQAQSDSLGDTQAAKNVGNMLARRCLESGILFVHKEIREDESKSPKVNAFLAALRDGGLKLREPDMIFPRRLRDL